MQPWPIWPLATLKIFQEVPVSLWEEDWSAVIALVRDLHRQGITNFAAYAELAYKIRYALTGG